MLWSEQWGTIGLQAPAEYSSLTPLIHPAPFRAPRILLVVIEGAQPLLRPLHLAVRRDGKSLARRGDAEASTENGERRL